MIKPYIVCHMMTSVDGRIDCAMTEHLPGVQEYYDTLNALDAPTRISGRVTAELEMALPESLRPRPPKHWHGAKKDSWFSHIAVEVPGKNCRNEWCEPVSDEEYNKL